MYLMLLGRMASLYEAERDDFMARILAAKRVDHGKEGQQPTDPAARGQGLGEGGDDSGGDDTGDRANRDQQQEKSMRDAGGRKAAGGEGEGFDYMRQVRGRLRG